MSREGYAAGGIASRLVRKLLKRHKKDPEVKSSIYKVKEEIDEIDSAFGDMGDEGKYAGTEFEGSVTKEDILSLERDREYLIEALEEIEATGTPLDFDETGFPVLDDSGGVDFYGDLREGYAAGGLYFSNKLARRLLKKFKKHPEVKKIDKEIKEHEKWIKEGGPESERMRALRTYGTSESDLNYRDLAEMSDEFAEMELSMLHQEKLQILQSLEAEDAVGKIERNPYPNREDFQEGGEIDEQMTTLMGETEQTPTETLLPDEEMEDNFVDYIVESTLSPEDTNYLEEALATDDRLSMIFDQVVETASEFSGSGPVEGPGTEVSDSIPARLSDGEFVVTAKAADQIGPDNLQGMMEQAEMDADLVDRREMAEGGVSVAEDIDEDVILPQLGVLDTSQREMLKLQLSSNPRTQYRTVYG